MVAVFLAEAGVKGGGVAAAFGVFTYLADCTCPPLIPPRFLPSPTFYMSILGTFRLCKLFYLPAKPKVLFDPGCLIIFRFARVAESAIP